MTRRTLITTLLVPLAVTVISSVVALAWLSDLPAQVATHWGLDGTADGFSAPAGFILGTAAISLIMTGVFAAIVHDGAQRGVSWSLKIIAVVPLFTSLLFASLLLFSLAAQRGLADGSDVPVPVAAIVVGLVGGIAAAVVAWILLPKSVTAEPVGVTPAGTTLSSSERVLWVRAVRAPLPMLLAVGAVALLIVISALVAPGPPWVWVLLGVVLLLLVGTISWRVRVDGTGVSVRALFGLPRFRIPLERIGSASVPEVNPLIEFGGWGIRFGAGRRVGVILGAGDALEVHRTDGRSLVVTVADASAAAALVNGLVERRQRVE